MPRRAWVLRLGRKLTMVATVPLALVPLMLAGVVLGGLGGCARYYWSRPGSTPEEFARDSQECAREALAAQPAQGETILVSTRYRVCLNARGYSRDKQYEPVPPGFYRGIE